MEDLKTNAANLADHVQDLAQTYIDLARIHVAQAGSRAIARAMIFFMLAGLILCILLLAGIGLSLFLGNRLNNAATGYFIVAFIYLILVVLFYLLRKKIVFPFIRNFIVRKIYDKTDNEL
jgi:hypothetical protein